jgi:hypothetical protein
MTARNPFRLAAKSAALWAAFALSLAAVDASNALTLAEDEQASSYEQAGAHLPRRVDDTALGYYAVAPDPRLCPSPLCGGYWVARVNQPLTDCADGTRAQRCYVAELDLAATGLSPGQIARVRSATGHLLLRGAIVAKTFPAFGNLGVLRGREAWIGHARVVASGTFYRARDTGIVCIAYPCPTVRIALLGQERPTQTIAGVDLRDVAADPADGYAQLNTPEGLVAAGDLVEVSGPAGSSHELAASEYYLPVEPELALCATHDLPACAPDEGCDVKCP